MKLFRLLGKHNKSVQIGDWSIGILITAIACWVYWVGNSSLYFSHGDAVWLHDMFNEMLKSGDLMGQSAKDFRSGLGVWLSPAVPILDLPTLFAMLPSGKTNETIYGAVSVASLYFSGCFLTRQFSTSPITPRVAGTVFAFVTFLPSPFMWSRVPLQGNHTWLLSAASVAVAFFVRALNASSKRRYLLDVAGMVFALLAGVAAWSLWVVPVLGFWIVVGIAGVVSVRLSCRKTMTAIRTWLIGATPLILIAVPIGLMISNTASVVARETAVGYVLDLKEPRPWFFDDTYPIHIPGTSVSLYGLLIVASVVAGIVIAVRSESDSEKFLARITAVSLLLLSLYSIVHYVFQLRQFEVGPSPGYLALFLFPFWSSAISLIPQRFITPRFMVTSSETGTEDIWTNRERRAIGSSVSTVVLACLLITWAIVWSVRNWDLRESKQFYPREPSAVISHLTRITAELDQVSFSGRVLILQPTDSGRDDVNNTVLYPTPRTKALRQELIEARIPTLSAYSHLSSPEYMRAMSAWFAGGKSFTRLWSVFEDLDVNVARILGVRYVISESPLDVSDAVSFLGKFDKDYLYQLNDPNLGDFSPTRIYLEAKGADPLEVITASDFDPRRNAVASQEIDDLVPVSSGSFTAEQGKVVVTVETSGYSLLVLPIEYSSCMKVVSSAKSAEVIRVNYLLTGLLVSESGRYTLEVRRNPYAFQTCS